MGKPAPRVSCCGSRGAGSLLPGGCVRHTDGVLPARVARFTLVVVDGAGYGVLRYWCSVSQRNRSNAQGRVAVRKFAVACERIT